jgi:hypothetical protein
MSTIRYLCGCILSAAIAAAAVSFLDNPSVSGAAGSLQAVRSSGGAVTVVNRDRKSDRLPVSSGTDAAAPASLGNTTVVRKNAASPEPAKGPSGSPTRQAPFEMEQARPIPLVGCEPVASPFADPALGRITGRCVA